jgi:segregation and condensation protein B
MSPRDHETIADHAPMTEPMSDPMTAPTQEPMEDQAMELCDELRLLEALLFASPSPVDEEAIKQRLPDSADIPALIHELTAFYAPRGVNIVHVGGGWTIRTAPDLAPRLKLTQKVGRKLSRAAIETLAIVAYHQPVTRAEIEEIRGVVISKGTLDTLMEAGWIVPKGRKQTVGRPVTWVTTEAFLLHFGLAALTDLPGIDELRAAGLIGPRQVSNLAETIGVPAEERLPDVPGEDEGEGSEAHELEPPSDEDDSEGVA